MYNPCMYQFPQLARVSSRIFCLGGEDCVQRLIVCEACKVFEPIFEPINARKNIKPEFLLLDIVLLSKLFGGEVGGVAFGGEASPLHPPVDETLLAAGFLSTRTCMP